MGRGDGRKGGPRRSAGVAGCVLAWAAVGCAASPARPVPRAHRAILDLSISATGGGTTVRFLAGLMASFQTTAAPPGAAVTPTPELDGVVVSGLPGPRSSVDVRTVFEEPVGTDDVTISLARADAGSTDVRVAPVPGGAGPVVHATLAAGRGGGHHDFSVARNRLFGAADPTPAPADPRRLVLATYYPWFEPGNENSPTMADRPVGDDDANDPASVDASTRLARANGIDGFVVSWQGNQNLAAFQLAAAAAERTGGVVAPFIETADANAGHDPAAPADPGYVERFVREAVAATTGPASLRLGGRPVLFVYAMDRLAPSVWVGIARTMAAAGTPVVLIGDGGWPAYTDVDDGWFLFDPNTMGTDGLRGQYQFADVILRAPTLLTPTVPTKVFVATVSPGTDARRLRGPASPVVERGTGGARYQATWDAARAAHPDWILVNSWNEWFEDTQVEPGRSSGSMALLQTASESRAFKR